MSDWDVPRVLLDVLADCLKAEDWMDDAHCAGEDPEIFFSDDKEIIAEARAICAGCPVRSECDLFGEGAKFGVWAGEDKTPRQGRPKRKACSKGHPFTPESVRLDRGWQRCRVCDRERSRKSHAAKMARKRAAEEAA